MIVTLVDSNVLLDVVTQNPQWGDWSAGALAQCADEGCLCINCVIYAEVSMGYHRIEEVEAVLAADDYRRTAIPMEAAFLAGKAFLRYRRNGGTRTSTLPDFFIGAHAAVANMRLLTRDGTRYRTYFPSLTLVEP